MIKKQIKKTEAKATKKHKVEVVIYTSQMGTGISSRVFNVKTGKFIYSSWVNRNLKTSKTNYKLKYTII